MTDDATINALVAEHVLGLLRIEVEGVGPFNAGAFGVREQNRWAWEDPADKHISITPDACNDGRVMLRVIEAMRERNCTYWIESEQGDDGHGAGVTFTQYDSGDEFVDSFQATDVKFPRAVALAALKALGVEVTT